MATSTKRVNIDTHALDLYKLSGKVANSIKSKGYVIGDVDWVGLHGDREVGRRLKSIEDLRNNNQIAILKDKPEAKGKGGLYRYLHGVRADFIGKLILENKHSATIDNWVMEVYGAKNQSEIKELAAILSKENDVNISVKVYPNEKIEYAWGSDEA